MKTVRLRTIAKASLVGALAVAITALIFFDKMDFPLMLTLLAVAVCLIALAVVLTVAFWRCPFCRKRFGVYDVKTEETKCCPYCNRYFGPEKKAEDK